MVCLVWIHNSTNFIEFVYNVVKSFTHSLGLHINSENNIKLATQEFSKIYYCFPYQNPNIDTVFFEIKLDRLLWCYYNYLYNGFCLVYLQRNIQIHSRLLVKYETVSECKWEYIPIYILYASKQISFRGVYALESIYHKLEFPSPEKLHLWYISHEIVLKF